MAGVFISHSSADAARAQELRQLLLADGHHVFLDVDPIDGIAPGSTWEQALYAKLRACRALVFLCTARSLASMWCFAELTHARSLLKPVIPVSDGRVDVVDTPFALVTDRQAVDLASAGGEAALRRALRNLDDPFAWDGRRPPYPGLDPFQEQDAALFFGRRRDLRDALDQLNALRGSGGARLMLVLGPSGSGKSSLLRAGVVPHLRPAPDHWLLVGPFRPSEGLGDPHDNLASAIAAAWRRHAGSQPADLQAALAAPGPPHAWLRVARDLAVAAGRREATVLLVVDQLEELLGATAGDREAGFLTQMCAALTASQALESCPLMVLTTLRSDFVGNLQTAEPFATVAAADHLVRPIPRSAFAELVEGPAAVIGLRLGPGLAQRVATDAATDDALPLLAFTMAQLWRRYGDDGELTLDEYEALGGLEGSVQEVVERELTAGGLSADQEAALHAAFVPHLVEIDDEGRYRRRRARRSKLPGKALPLLDRLVRARLLTRDADTYEVTHEALFRVWDRLADWLGEDRDFLAWRRRAEGTARWWLDHARDDGGLLRGGALAEARRWAQTRSADLGTELGELVAASVAREELEARERAEREDVLRRRLLATEARDLVLAAEAEIAHDPQLSLLLAIEAADRSCDGEGAVTAAEASLLQRTVLATVPRLDLECNGIESVAWHPSGRWLAAGSSDGVAMAIDTVTGETRTLHEQDRIESVAWSHDGRWLASGAQDGTVVVWDPLGGGGRRRGPHLTDQVQSVSWRRGTSTIAVGVARGAPSAVVVWDLDRRGGARVEVPGIRGAWSPDGAVLATGGFEGAVRFYTAQGAELAVLPGHDRYVHALAWTSDGLRLATASVDDQVIVWDAVAHARLKTLEAPFALGTAWTPDGSLLGASSGNRYVTVWDGDSYELRFTVTGAETITGDLVAGTGAADYVVSIAWSPDGTRLAASDRGGLAGHGAIHLLQSVIFAARTGNEWLAVAHRHVRRGLTQEERDRYLLTARV